MGCNTSKSAEVENKNGPKAERPIEEQPLTEGETNAKENSTKEDSNDSSRKENAETTEPAVEADDRTNSPPPNGPSEPEAEPLTGKSEEATEPTKATDGGELDNDAAEVTESTNQLPESDESHSDNGKP